MSRVGQQRRQVSGGGSVFFAGARQPGQQRLIVAGGV
jgi:hypothetical protein